MITLLLGILGLGLVVFFHELGHFIAAKSCGIEVEVFSLGWGPKLFGFKPGKTEYRVSLLPLGGFCKMKGEKELVGALEANSDAPMTEEGSFYAAAPWKRIVVSLSGPVANVVFAVVAFFVVYSVGFTMAATPATILLQRDYIEMSDSRTPAELAGFMSGDTILAIDGKAIGSYGEIREAIALSGAKPRSFDLVRDGTALSLTATPAYNSAEGKSTIGVLPAVRTAIGKVAPDGSAAIAGIKTGDTVIAIDGVPVLWTYDIVKALDDRRSKAVFTVLRNGAPVDVEFVLSYDKDGIVDLGLEWVYQVRETRGSPPLEAMGTALRETWTTFVQTLEGIGKLFTGLAPQNALSGPARITVLLSDVTEAGFEGGTLNGFISLLRIISFLSISLFIMNLLPIPALDGGMIVIFVIELIRKKPLSAKALFRFQLVGAIFILSLLVLSTVFDIVSFTK